MVGAIGFELEALCGSQSPQPKSRARQKAEPKDLLSQDGVGKDGGRYRIRT